MLDTIAFLTMPLVVTCSTERAEIGWVERFAWCLLYCGDVVNPSRTHPTDVGMAHDATVSVTSDDTLA
jgi:hypothetical protein